MKPDRREHLKCIVVGVVLIILGVGGAVDAIVTPGVQLWQSVLGGVSAGFGLSMFTEGVKRLQ